GAAEAMRLSCVHTVASAVWISASEIFAVGGRRMSTLPISLTRLLSELIQAYCEVPSQVEPSLATKKYFGALTYSESLPSRRSRCGEVIVKASLPSCANACRVKFSST